MKVQKQKPSKIKEFLKPIWKKQVLALIVYLVVGAKIAKFLWMTLKNWGYSMHLPEPGFLIGTWLIFLLTVFPSFALCYLLSCVIWKNLKRDRIKKVKVWEITMFIGMILGCGTPLGLFGGGLLLYELYPLIPGLPELPLGMAAVALIVLYGGIISGAVFGILIGLIINLITLGYNKLKMISHRRIIFGAIIGILVGLIVSLIIIISYLRVYRPYMGIIVIVIGVSVALIVGLIVNLIILIYNKLKK